MGDISSSFNAAAISGANDNLQDVESFRYDAQLGSPTAQTATPAQPSNAVQLVNCSPCPLKLTINIPAVDANGKPLADENPIPKCVVAKPGETVSLNFKKDVIMDATIEEAATAPTDALTPDAGAAVNAAASVNLQASLRFFNC